MNLYFRKYWKYTVILALLIINLCLLLLYVPQKNTENFPELSKINSQMDFGQLSEFFQNLAKEKGGRYAFKALKVAQLGPNIDLHLLGHGVGDILYKQEGVNAVTACDNDFRNACSHSVVIGLFNDQGEAALESIKSACEKAPGGLGAYTMCFHGLGHGILSFEKYDMAKASKVCQKTGTPEHGYAEIGECISGMVMEIIGGGFHDKDVWSKQRVKYLDTKDPLGLCLKDYIPVNSRARCFDYLTPFLFEAAGATEGSPTSADFKKAFKFCEKLSNAETALKDSCYGGFGKEFDGLVQSRDIRLSSANSIPEDKLKTIHNWCALAGNFEGEKSCIIHALNSLYWGGENNVSTSISFCNQSKNEDYKKICFDNLTNNVAYYVKDVQYRESYCKDVPQNYTEDCGKKLLNK